MEKPPVTNSERLDWVELSDPSERPMLIRALREEIYNAAVARENELAKQLELAQGISQAVLEIKCISDDTEQSPTPIDYISFSEYQQLAEQYSLNNRSTPTPLLWNSLWRRYKAVLDTAQSAKTPSKTHGIMYTYDPKWLDLFNDQEELSLDTMSDLLLEKRLYLKGVGTYYRRFAAWMVFEKKGSEPVEQ